MGELLPASVEHYVISALQHCRIKKSLHHARLLYALLCEHGLQSHATLGNYLVPVLVECGGLSDAGHAFHRLPYRNEYSWASLISAYAECAESSQHAFHLYQKMYEESVLPNNYSYVAMLKACTRMRNVVKGAGLHTEILKQGLEADLYIGSMMVDMYGSCDSIAEARHVFDRLPARDAVLWNAMMGKCVEHGLSKEALDCYEEMQLEGVSPADVTYVCSLKACGSLRDLERGRLLCAEVSMKGLEGDIIIGSSIIDMYAKCGSLMEAQQVSAQLPLRNVVSWNALIAGYSERGLSREAASCLEQMQLEGISPDDATYTCSLKACTSVAGIARGQKLHTELTIRGFERDLYVGTTLVDMYVKCGSLAEARDVFDELPVRNQVSWAALVSGYTELGLDQEVLSCFKRIQLEGASVDVATFVSGLKACGTLGALETGRELHAEIRKAGLEKEISVANTLVDMYSKCGSLEEAQQVFTKLSNKDVVSWNALIAGYTQHGLAEQALHSFEQMKLEQMSPDDVTFVLSLKACGNIQAIERGWLLCTEIVKQGLDKDLLVGNTMLDMYTKCGLLGEAQNVFDKLPSRNTVSCNALITGYAEVEDGEEALTCLKQMQLEGVLLDDVTFACGLKACGITREKEKGHELHAEILRRGRERELTLGTQLISMYIMCGLFPEAQDVFDRLPVRDTVVWSALVSGYVEYGLNMEVLNTFKQMQMQTVSADAGLFVHYLRACSIIGAIEIGREIHAEIRKSGLEKDPSVASMLVYMYGQCGLLAEAREVFDKLPAPDTIAWTAMIRAYGENQEGSKAVQCFEEMRGKGLKPDAITFTSLFTVCSHCRLVAKGREYFEMMKRDYNIDPTADHFTCIADLLARSGHISEAEKFAEAISPSKDLLRTLLAACKLYGEVEAAERCFQQLVQVKQEDATAYSLMADIYATVGRWQDADRVEDMRKHAGETKKPASVIIDVNKVMREFIVGDVQSEDISAMVEILSARVKDEGHMPNLDVVLNHVSSEANKTVVSESLTNAYFLNSTDFTENIVHYRAKNFLQ